jgi:hypothetical protein
MIEISGARRRPVAAHVEVHSIADGIDRMCSLAGGNAVKARCRAKGQQVEQGGAGVLIEQPRQQIIGVLRQNGEPLIALRADLRPCGAGFHVVGFA